VLPVRFRSYVVHQNLNAGCRARSEEIFGPVLTVLTSDTLDDALSIINENRYGNGAVIFTQSGATARKFESEVNVGQVRLHSYAPWFWGAASIVD